MNHPIPNRYLNLNIWVLKKFKLDNLKESVQIWDNKLAYLNLKILLVSGNDLLYFHLNESEQLLDKHTVFVLLEAVFVS